MNKNIKRVIALTLAISAYGTIMPATGGYFNIGTFNIGTKVAFASSYSPSDRELKSLTVKSTNGDTLDLKDDYNGDTVKLSDDKEYYVKLTDDSEGIKVSAEAEGEDYVVKIFISDNNDATAYNPGDKILLGKGNSTIYVRTYESLSAYRKAKDTQKNVRLCKEEYTINVKKTTESSYEDVTQDAIYLDKLEISKINNLDFLKQKTSYDVKVDSSVSEVKITAKPEDKGDRVRIDGSLVDENDNYRKTIYLDNGKNEIKIKVTDDKDNQRTYTLNITRGNSTNQDSVYLDELELSEGKIEFIRDTNSYEVNLDENVDKIDITARPEDSEYLVTVNEKELKSSDDYKKRISLDKGTNTIKIVVQDEVNDKKRSYTLKVNRGQAKTTESNNSSGNNTNADAKKPGWVQTAEGWKYNDVTGTPIKNNWLYDREAKVYCYLDENGLRKTGWFKDKEKWYLLDDKGIMLTGWQEKDGKKYLLESSGAMKTGWYKEEVTNKDNTKTNKWYYLNSDGSMRVGWLLDDGKWYYLNKDGVMQTGWLIDSNSKYYLNSDGSMVKGSKVIEGKTYKFAASGALII